MDSGDPVVRKLSVDPVGLGKLCGAVVLNYETTMYHAFLQSAVRQVFQSSS